MQTKWYNYDIHSVLFGIGSSKQYTPHIRLDDDALLTFYAALYYSVH